MSFKLIPVAVLMSLKKLEIKLVIYLSDTQEAPKSLTIDSSSSLESLASVDNDFSHSDNELNACPPQNLPPNKPMVRIPPPFSRTVLPTKRLGGAFTSYVRRRGEPDGRTANPADAKVTVDNKTRKMNTLARPGGGESDAAFTPSPPVAMQNENQTIALSLAHQTRIRNLYMQSDAKVSKLSDLICSKFCPPMTPEQESAAPCVV